MKNKRKPYQSLRRPNFDYNSTGQYFVTFCVKDKRELLGQVVCGKMELSPWGHIADLVWKALPTRYPNLTPEAFQIMPDHIHLLFHWTKVEIALGITELIGSYKSLIYFYVRNCVEQGPIPIFWQRSFHDRIIRTEAEHHQIKQYIKENPLNW